MSMQLTEILLVTMYAGALSSASVWITCKICRAGTKKPLTNKKK